MNGGSVIFTFKADDKELKQKTTSVGDIIKGNLASAAIIKGIGAVNKGINSIGNAIGNLITKPGLDRALNIENARFKLQGLGNTAEQTEQIMQNALAAVKGTAYGLDEAATVAASAVAAGIKPGEELERTLKLVGDAAAISGRDMAAMGAVFNKVATSGKLQGEELNQFADAGIPIVQLLADTLGKTTEEIYEMSKAGEIGFADLQKAIEKGMGGAALTMGQTFSGALSNMKAAFSRLGATIMTPLQQGLTPVMGNITNIIDAIASGSTDKINEEMSKMGENITSMINNFISTLNPILQNAIPVIQQVILNLANLLPGLVEQLLPPLIETTTELINSLISTLPELITTLLPVILNSVMSIIQGIVAVLPNIIQAISSMLPEILTTLTEMLPQILQQIINTIPIIAQSLSENLPTLIPVLIEGIIALMDVFNQNMPLFLEAGAKIIIGLIKGLINSIPLILQNLGTIIEFIINFFSISKLLGAGKTLLTGLGNGLIKGIPELIRNIPKIIGNMVNYFKTNGVSSFKTIGIDLIRGLWNGIKNVQSWILGKIAGFGKSILKSIKGIFGIHSPSKEFAWIGKMNVLGLEEGMESMQSDLQTTFDGMFDLSPNLYGRTSTNLSPQVNVTVNNNMETDPLGQMVNKIKTFSGGSKNDYNYGMGV